MKAKKLLSNCKDEHNFWCNNGEVYKSLAELANGLKNISPDAFSHHVSAEKNDFHNWVRDVFQDPKLAADLKIAKNNKWMSSKVEARLKELKNTRNPLRQ